jgi:aldose 1-epimerase
MYELTKSAFGKRTRFDLQNPATGTGFSIVPECGANVLDIRFGGQSILDGYASPDELEAGKWGKSSVLFPFPNRLNGGKYNWLGQAYQFPLNNAATANAIHGFAREEAFEVEYFFLAKDCASIRCSYDYEGQRPYYPFPFALDLEFTIHDDGTFSLEVEVENVHPQPIPVGFGWHPYFRLAERADDHRLQLPACEKVAIDERMIPTGERTKFADFQRIKSVGDAVLDNCFQYAKASGDYEMALESAEHRLLLNASAKQFPFFQVFTPPHRQSVALEPMTCNVDAFNNQQGLVTLGVGASWKGNMEIRFERV